MADLDPSVLLLSATVQYCIMSSIPFDSPNKHGFIRVAATSPAVVLAHPMENAAITVEMVKDAAAQHVDLITFPELNLCGYTCEELFHQQVLLDACRGALQYILEASIPIPITLVIGMPLQVGSHLYNCAIVLRQGQIYGIVPKQHLPNYREYYERRYFTPGQPDVVTIRLCGQDVPMGANLLFQQGDSDSFTFGVELCEDAWVPNPPSTLLALSGATIICNLSASNITTGKPQYRESLVRSHSARLVACYVYASAGSGESTNDMAWDGHCLIAENGRLLAEIQTWNNDGQLVIVDTDVESLLADRLKFQSFAPPCAGYKVYINGSKSIISYALKRDIERFPYVPADDTQRDRRCDEVYNIQVAGLIQRIKSAGLQRLVIGVSGGLDSTHALLVCCQAADKLGWTRSQITAVTMPGFATSQRTIHQADQLMNLLGVTAETIDIKPSCLQMLADIHHPFFAGQPVYDVTFENVQAGERTSHLFRIANFVNGMVVGTGDLSEIALGWCTYGVGDHMSHYAVNASVPKTLIQYLIGWLAVHKVDSDPLRTVLTDIVNTDISPELVPGDSATDQPIQKTEDIIGPYSLQDFTLYYVTRYGMKPSKILYLALQAWSPTYDATEIARWMTVFINRFFQNQFKRTCIPNGPKVGSGGSLSPRGDWRMPSDASSAAWIADLNGALEALLKEK